MLTLERTFPRYARPSFLRRLADAMALGRQRIHLGQLDDHMLRDIGLSRREAEAEAARPIWDAPTHWKR